MADMITDKNKIMNENIENNEICARVMDNLDRYIDGELRDDEREEFLSHLETCGSCKETAEQAAALTKAMKNLAHEKTPDGFASGVMEKIKTRPAPKRRWTTAGKIATGVAACGLVFVVIIAAMFGGGANAPQANKAAYENDAASSSYYRAESGGSASTGMMPSATAAPSLDMAMGETEKTSYLSDASSYGALIAPKTPEEATSPQYGQKIIKNGYLYINSYAFESDAAFVESVIAAAGGYAQYSSLSGKPLEPYTYNSYSYYNYGRYGYYTYRIPSDRYNEVVAQLKQIGVLESYSENADDITSQYYDTQARIDSYKLQYKTIEALLAKAEKLEDILIIQSELTTLQYQIDSLTGTLKQWDFLTSYSTLQLTLQETADPTLIKPVDNSLGSRVKESFVRSINRLIDGFESFVVWIAGSALALAVVIAVAAVIIIVIRRSVKKRRARTSAKNPDTPDNPDK